MKYAWNYKIPIVREGQACRHCDTPVVKQIHKKNWKPKRKQPYWFEYWFRCPNRKCKAMYMVESAKRYPYKEPSLDEQLTMRLEREP